MLAPGQKERFLFGLRVLVFPAESHVRVLPFGIKEGVIHGSGRAPSLGSSFAKESSRLNQGAWPCGGISAMTSEA